MEWQKSNISNTELEKKQQVYIKEALEMAKRSVTAQLNQTKNTNKGQINTPIVLESKADEKNKAPKEEQKASEENKNDVDKKASEQVKAMQEEKPAKESKEAADAPALQENQAAEKNEAPEKQEGEAANTNTASENEAANEKAAEEDTAKQENQAAAKTPITQEMRGSEEACNAAEENTVCDEGAEADKAKDNKDDYEFTTYFDNGEISGPDDECDDPSLNEPAFPDKNEADSLIDPHTQMQKKEEANTSQSRQNASAPNFNSYINEHNSKVQCNCPNCRRKRAGL